jgi:Tfp pilus assembly pilus retraction ATPase PilT
MAVDKRLEELLDIVVSQNGSDLHVFAGGAPTIRVAGERNGAELVRARDAAFD